ncbi:MAG: AAA family ATPase [Oscillospiraceae bacterium]
MQEKIKEILDQIETVIVGKNEVMERILMAILAGGHVLMEDVPGVGKTTTAMTFARVLGLETRRVQFTSDTMPSDIIGFSVYDKDTGKLVYKPGAVMTNLLLADEDQPYLQQNAVCTSGGNGGGHVSIDGKTHPLPDPFIVLATQNPAGSAGTQMLPNSQLDRFLVKLTMGYPDFKSQVSILEERHTENPLDRVHPVVGAEELNALKQRAAAVEMKTSVYEYVTRLAEATRVHSLVQLGLSPRGALAVCRMAKAYAYVQGRDYAMPEDVAAIFPDVCCHRLMLSTKARMMERSAEQIVDEILKNVEMPVIRKSREGV